MSDEPCRRCGTLLEATDCDGTRTMTGGNSGRVVRFSCPSCNAGGSIQFDDGEIQDRIGPAVATDIETHVDSRRTPTPDVDHEAIATDGGTWP